MASQVALEVVIPADNADFSGLDDDGVDNSTEPGLTAFDSSVGKALDKGQAECIQHLCIEHGLLDQMGFGALECGLGEITLLPDVLHAAL